MAKKKQHKSISFALPFPPKELNPNCACHYMKKAKAKKMYRSMCCALTYQANKHQFHDLKGKVTVNFVFHTPTKARYDEDNLIARMKAGIDGIATAIRTDDSNFHYAPVKIGEPIKGGLVEVRLSFFLP